MSYKRISPQPVVEGGTGAQTFTSHGVLLGEGTSAIGVTAAGTTGQVLTGVTGSDPTFQSPAASSISITGDTGGALTGAAFTFTGGTTGLSFGGAGSTETLTFAGITANNGVVNLGTDNAANAINIGVGTTARTIHIGDSAAAHTIDIGSSSVTAVNVVGPTNINVAGSLNTAIGSTSNSGTISIGNTSSGVVTIGCGTAGILVGTTANAHASTFGSTTASCTTTIQAPSGGVILTGVQGVAVSNKNYVTINTSTGAIGSDAGPSSSITITGDTGGGLTGSSFTFTGGTTGLTFAGAGSTETLGGTLAIANGGTNATSMATSTGIVKYDGTRLVTSSTAKIDSSNRTTNSSQPAFYAYVNASVSNVTGDGTAYTVIFNSTLFDQNSNFNTGSGTFTAPVTGNYMLTFFILGQSLATTNNTILEIVTTGNTFLFGNDTAVGTGNNAYTFTVFAPMSANDTATCVFLVSGGTKSVGIFGAAAPSRTAFHGYLVC